MYLSDYNNIPPLGSAPDASGTHSFTASGADTGHPTIWGWEDKLYCYATGKKTQLWNIYGDIRGTDAEVLICPGLKRTLYGDPVSYPSYMLNAGLIARHMPWKTWSVPNASGTVMIYCLSESWPWGTPAPGTSYWTNESDEVSDWAIGKPWGAPSGFMWDLNLPWITTGIPDPPIAGPHLGAYNVMFADGHAGTFEQYNRSSLSRWCEESPPPDWTPPW